jgi:hypothetical protein
VVVIGQPVGGEHVVDAEVAGVVRHVVHAGVAEVSEDVALVEAGHGDLGDDHLEERGERGVDTLPVAFAA